MPALAAVVAVVLWGGSFAVTKAALDELSVATLVFSRSVLGFALVAAWLVARREVALPGARDLRWILALAILGNVVPQVLQANALRHSSAASTAWLVGLIPVVTAILAWRLVGERLEGKVAGILVALVGVLLVVSGGAPLAEVLRLPSSRGDALTLVSTVSWSLYTIYGRDLVARYPAAVAMSHLLGASVLVFTPAFVAAGGGAELAALSPGGWLSVLYLGLGCSGIAFTLWYAALERMEAAQVATFIYLEPLVAQVLARWLIGEPLRMTTIAGGLAILAGVYLVSRTGAVPAAAAVAERETA